MSWNVTLGGQTYSSLDLTLDEVEALERISGQPWAVINPLASVKSAKAYLAVFALREGQPDDVVVAGVSTLTLREVAGAFEWVDDEKTPAPKKRAKGRKPAKTLDPPKPDRSSPNGSTTGRSGSDGIPEQPADNASATSTSS